MPKSQKQAVLLIHGIGEQRPMDTLRSFVRAVWATDKDVKHEHATPGIFSKPDEISDSFELRRLTTTSDRKDVRTDFYEFYWAHLMEGTSLRHVWAWGRRLLFRWPWNVPKRLIGAWLLLVIALLVVAFFAALTVLPDSYRPSYIPKWLTGVLGTVVAGAAVPMINSIVGDAARYLDPAPSNIQRRQEIRAKAVEILKKLHQSNEYQRIIVVGHSLGSVIGYDMLTYLWPRFGPHLNEEKRHPILDQLEVSVAQHSIDRPTYQRQQRELLREQQQNGSPWLVTDFITLGSPLTHAEVLLARDKDDLLLKQTERELPTCPPMLEKEKFSFLPDHAHRRLHHAAVFGPTRWSNLYFPASWIFRGDFIGGPLADAFGWGIADYKVHTTLRGGWLSHTLYWSMESVDGAEEHISTLRKALNLLDD